MGENSFSVPGHDAARCGVCGGLVAADADWCGQCFSPVTRQAEVAAGIGRGANAGTAEVAARGSGGVAVAGGSASWDCPVCGEHNPIEAAVCQTCQTPFARLFEERTERPEVAARTAALWSLAFAGLGHWRAGYRADGVARMVLLGWTLGTVLIMLSSRSHGGFGSASPLLVLYLGSALAIYAMSAVDAYRIADGASQLVSSRVLLWASAALVLLSIALATLVTLPAARG